MLAHSEIAAHEKECLSRCYTCPLCSLKLTSFNFVGHYKKDHADAVLEKPEIILTVNKECEFEKYYMYRENDFIYILYVRCNLNDSCFYVNAACLGPSDRVHKIKQHLKYYLGTDRNSDELFLVTKKRNCSIVENNLECFKLPFFMNMKAVKISFFLDMSDVNFSNYITDNTICAKTNSSNEIIGLHNEYPKMFLSKEFKSTYPDFKLSSCGTTLFKNCGEEFPRICEFCENIFPNSKSIKLYGCICEHTHCDDCYAIRPCCCKTYAREFVYPCDQSNVYNSLYFYCKWNCGIFFSGPNLRGHEDCCKFNKDTCELPELAAKYFTSYSSDQETNIISRSNIFLFKQFKFHTDLNIFVITRDYFKFVLHVNYDNRMWNFTVSHDYPKDKYYLLFKINESQESSYCCVDSFRCHIDQAILGFAVLLRKVC